MVASGWENCDSALVPKFSVVAYTNSLLLKILNLLIITINVIKIMIIVIIVTYIPLFHENFIVAFPLRLVFSTLQAANVYRL